MEKMVNRNRFRAASAAVVQGAGRREIGRGNGYFERGGMPPGKSPGYLEAAAS